MEAGQTEYNYEEERKKLKLGPFATCVLLFKTTVGVGIFTYQWAYSKVAGVYQCGFVLGTLLSALVFYMVIYGMYRLLELCDLIEDMETEKRKQLTKPIPLQPQGQPSGTEVDDKSVNGEAKEPAQISELGSAAVLNVEPRVEDIYEVSSTIAKFQVITYHRTTS